MTPACRSPACTGRRRGSPAPSSRTGRGAPGRSSRCSPTGSTPEKEWPAMPDNRRLVVTENISANGVIEFVDDWFDPADQGDAEDLFTVMGAQMAREEALLLGRKTFEDFRGYWPLQTDDASGSTAHLNRVPKYVVSSTMTDPAWSHSTVLSGRLEDEVAALKAHGDG